MAKLIKGINDLATKNPRLAQEWHPTKNYSLTPYDVTVNSVKKVWWLCPQGHEYETKVINRGYGSNCPYCAGQKVIKGVNDLATISQFLASEFHPTKNNDLKQCDIMPNSMKKIWWLCSKCQYEWQATPNARYGKGTGCPQCAKETQTSFPEYVLYYYIKQLDDSVIHSFNDLGFELDIYIPTKRIGIEYDGGKWHKNKVKKDKDKNKKCVDNGITLYRIRENLSSLDDTSIDYISNGKDLDYVISELIKEIYNEKIDINIKRDESNINNLRVFSEKENSLAIKNPILSKEWHPTKNEKLKPEHFTIGSSKRVWWLGHCCHEWYARVIDRIRGENCPYCANKKVLEGFNDLAFKNPKLASEWHPIKNGNLKPNDIFFNSGKKVWWMGSCGHEWEDSVATRNKTFSCPYCSNRRVLVGYNDLASKYPRIASEWHPIKNGILKPTDVVYGSGKNVWWLSDDGKEWQATIHTRTQYL